MTPSNSACNDRHYYSDDEEPDETASWKQTYEKDYSCGAFMNTWTCRFCGGIKKRDGVGSCKYRNHAHYVRDYSWHIGYCSVHNHYGGEHYYCTTHNYVGTSSTCPGLTVKPSPSLMSVYYGQTKQITPNQNPSSATVTYTSSSSRTASVSSTGLVTGKNKGSTSITVIATL